MENATKPQNSISIGLQLGIGTFLCGVVWSEKEGAVICDM